MDESTQALIDWGGFPSVDTSPKEITHCAICKSPNISQPNARPIFCYSCAAWLGADGMWYGELKEEEEFIYE